MPTLVGNSDVQKWDALEAGICEAKMDEFGKITLKMFDGSHIPQQETQDEFK